VTVEVDGRPRRGACRRESIRRRQACPAGARELILKRCAWHWLHRLAFTGVAKWRPLWPPRLSDGMCPWCARQALKELDLQGRRTAWRFRARRGRPPTYPLRTATRFRLPASKSPITPVSRRRVEVRRCREPSA